MALFTRRWTIRALLLSPLLYIGCRLRKGDQSQTFEASSGAEKKASRAPSLPPALAKDVYGVASANPTDSSVILWTRVADGAVKTLKGKAIKVQFEVSTTLAFNANDIVAQGEKNTDASHDFTVNVVAKGLKPSSYYFYRFKVGDVFMSSVGRTKTAPAPSDHVDVRVGVVSCQKYTDGLFAAFKHLAQEDVDFCLHEGDNIYERERGKARSSVLGEKIATTLDEYRMFYKQMLSDPAYREVRRSFPWIHTWDDHEVYNNFAGHTDIPKDPARVAAAYQAFLEYIPTSATLTLDAKKHPSVNLYNAFHFGQRLSCFTLDCRQYRERVERDEKTKTFDENKTMLGLAQKTWFKNQLSTSKAQWKLVVSSVMFTRCNYLSTGKVFLDKHKNDTTPSTKVSLLHVNLDQWDGYPRERAEILDVIHQGQIKDVVFSTGDLHTGYNAGVPRDCDHLESPSIAVEIVNTSVSSFNGADKEGVDFAKAKAQWLVRSNPHFSWIDLQSHGYATYEFREDGMEVRHVAVSTKAADAPAQVTRVAKVPRGESKFVSV